MKKDIKKLVQYYINKFDTRNPFELAEYLNVEVMTGPLGGRAGCYMFIKNHKCIFLNEDLEDHERTLVWLTNWLIRYCIENRTAILSGIKLFCSHQSLRLKPTHLRQSFLSLMNLFQIIQG